MNPRHLRLLAITIGMLAGVSSLFAAPPAAPSGTKVVPLGTTRQVVSWTDNASDETGFTIERLDGSTWTFVANTAANTTKTVLSAQPTGTQTYRVTATNGDGSSAPSPGATTLRMNVLFFLADDMGYKDIVAYRNETTDGPTIYETPALDSLVSQGVSFHQAYCSGPKCVVARRALQTGMHDFRTSTIAKNGGVPVENVTVGEAMQAAGYRTCFIGKWHLGGHIDGSTGGEDNDSGGSFPPHTTPPYTNWSLLPTTDNKYIPATDPNHDEANKIPSAQGYHVAIATGEWGAPPTDPGTSYNPQTNGYYPTLITGSSPAEYWYGLPDLYTSSNTEYLTDRLTTEATGFISNHIAGANQGQPFFLTLAHYAVHTPLQADPARVTYFQNKRNSMNAQFAAHPGGAQFIKDYSSDVRQHQDQPIYAAMMDSFDDSLAAIRTYLAATDDPRNSGMKLADTTIIVLSSDHGGKSTHTAGQPDLDGIPTSNYPLRQGKTWIYEGGLKIPLVVYWPGFSAVNAGSNALINATDIYTTILDMTGSPRVTGAHLDSISFAECAITPTLQPRTENYHWFTNADEGTGNPALAAYRFGDYKLVYHIIRRVWELYDLGEDPGETNNIASIRPDLVTEFHKKLIARVVSTEARRPVPGSNSWNKELLVVAVAGVSIPGTVPNGAAPATSAVAVSDSAIDVSWTDNSTDETSFVIQRKPQGSGSFAEIATVPANVTRYRDTGLSPGTGYQYRVYAENLRGWNPVSPTVPTAVTVATLGSSVPALPIIARGDYITTLVNETRVFQTLNNDQGKNLTITAITQGVKGVATITGSGTTITYVPNTGATGEDILTYTATASDGGTSTGYIRLNILANQNTTPPVTLVYDNTPIVTDFDVWDFNDANGTTLAAAAKTTGASVFTGASTPTVQSNALKVVAGGATGSLFRNATIASGARTLGASNSGVVQMSFRITSADLSGGANNTSNIAYVGIGTRGKDAANAASDPLQMRLQENSTTGNLELQARGESTAVCRTFTGYTLTQPLEVRVVMDLVAKNATVYSKLGTEAEVKHSTYAFTAAAVLWDTYRLAAFNNTTAWGTGDYVNVDWLKFGNVTYPAPPTAFQMWMDTAQGSVTPSASKAPDADPDGDGVKNIVEYAFGGHPFQSGTLTQFARLADTAADPDTTDELIFTLPVIPGTNFSQVGGLLTGTNAGITTRVLGSLDLSTFTSTVEEVYPAMESGLPPVRSGWEYRSFRMPASNGAPRAFMRASAETP